MNIKPSTSNVKKEITNESVFYRFDVIFYTLPPLGSLKLEDFETWSLERLQVLKTIAQVNQRISIPFTEDWKNAITDELKSQGLKDWARLISSSSDGKTEQELKMRRKDHVSHFSLRFAYCQNSELQNWFITQEIYLFKIRFMSLSIENIRTFLYIYSFQIKSIKEEEKNALENNLIESSYSLTKEKFDKTDFYKLKFHEVPDLVRSRRVFVKDGFAYVSGYDIVSYLCNRLKQNLQKDLEIIRKNLYLFDNDHDSRVRDLMILVEESNEVKPVQLNTVEGSVIPEDIDILSRSVFPPCMRAMHQQLRAAHHLKHGGRLEYGLFLKGIGLSVDDAIRFWREEFSRIMDQTKFQKEHVYAIRHIYGLEGKRKSKLPYGCDRLIETNLAPGDRHGCPFKHYGSEALRNLLKSWNTPNHVIGDIVNLASKRSCQPACNLYFEASQGVKRDYMISHPNLYYEEARKIQEDKNAGSKPQITKTHVKIMPKASTIKNEILDEDQVLMDIDLNESMDLN